jgi:hypothetical protein
MKLTETKLREIIKEEIQKLNEGGGHHFKYGKKWYVDSSFVNFCQRILPNSELKHMGFGEFELETPNGTVQFDRTNGKKFTGQVGRSHEMYDDVNGKLVAKLIKGMEQKKKSELVTEGLVIKKTRITKLNDLIITEQEDNNNAVNEILYDEVTVALRVANEMKTKLEKSIKDLSGNKGGKTKEMLKFNKKYLHDIEVQIKQLEAADKFN